VGAGTSARGEKRRRGVVSAARRCIIGSAKAAVLPVAVWDVAERAQAKSGSSDTSI
jgi:hypothetical protein